MDDADSFSLDIEPEGVAGGGLDPPIIRVYLASALTNVDTEFLAEAKRARSVIRETFQRYDYRGIRFEVYDPGEVTAPGSPHSNEEVYATDHHQTSESDLVVFYVSFPSIGVGMEAQIAAECTLPRVVVSTRKSRVSRMFKGVFSPTIASIEYGTTEELRELLSETMLEIAEAVVKSAKQRRHRVDEFCHDALGAKIMGRRLMQGMRLAELAAATDIREEWLQELERKPKLAGSVTLIQLRRIAVALNTNASVSLISGVPTLAPAENEEHLAAVERESLKNLVEFSRERDESVKDDAVFYLWKEYREEQAALRHREQSEEPVSPDEWNRRYKHGGRLF